VYYKDIIDFLQPRRIMLQPNTFVRIHRNSLSLKKSLRKKVVRSHSKRKERTFRLLPCMVSLICQIKWKKLLWDPMKTRLMEAMLMTR